MKKIKIIINGKSKTINTGMTIDNLIRELKFYPDTVVVSLNDVIMSKDAYGTKTLKDNDSIEIIRFISGG